MRVVVVLIMGLSLLKSFESHAQTKNEGAVVVFDPLFWKDELKLTTNQYKAIRNINQEYYSSIYRTLNENEGNISFLQTATQELLQIRSELIWDTFHPKQKKIWKKLSSAYGTDNQFSYSKHTIKVPNSGERL
jgi:hypothetical protein